VEGCKILDNIKERLICGEANQKGTLVYATSSKLLFRNCLKEWKGAVLYTTVNFILKSKHFDTCFILIYSKAAIIVSRKCVLYWHFVKREIQR